MYHITDKGEPGVCKAQKGGCPFGSPDEHFNSASQARYAYEARMNGEQPITPSLKKQKRIVEPVPVIAEEAAHDNSFNNGDHEIDYTPEQVLAKFERDIAGHTYAMSSTNNSGEPGLILERLFGKEPDSDPTADLGTVELKTLSKKILGRPISLGSLSMGGNVRELRQRFLGYNFQHSLKAGDWLSVGDYHYTLYVDRAAKRVRLIIANSDKQFVSTNDYGWDFASLENKVDKKLANIAVGLYETNTEKDGSRSVTYDSLVLGGFTRESIIDKIENGDVRIDFRFDKSNHRTTLQAPLKSFAQRMPSFVKESAESTAAN